MERFIRMIQNGRKNAFFAPSKFKYHPNFFGFADILGWTGEKSSYFWSINIPTENNPQLSSSSSTDIPSMWQQLVDRESERLTKQQEEQLFIPTKANCKDDITSWLPRTGWNELFKGKDPKISFLLRPS